MTDLVRYDGGLAESITAFGNLSGQIAKTDFVPDAFKNNPAAVLACMLFGQECGLGPMASLNLTQSIKGKVGLKPEGMRAVVQSHGHRIWPEEYTDTAVTLCGWRKGDPEDRVVRVRWTMEDAKRANLAGGDSWKKYPRAMLLARATSELCRLHFSDCTGGLAYGGDELEEIAGSTTQVVAHTRPPSGARVVDTPPLPADPDTGEVRKPRTRKPPVPVDHVEPRDPGSLPASDELKASIEDLIGGLKSCGDEWAERARGVWREHAPAKGVDRLFASEAEALEPALGALYREAVAAMQPTLDGDAA